MESGLKRVLLLGSGLLLSVMPLVSAYWNWYSGWGGNLFRPSDLLNNEWAVFIILFAIFYATIYASLGKVFHDNKAVPAIIALALSFLVSAGIQRQWMFLEKPILTWALILALLLVVVTFFRASKMSPMILSGVVLLLAGLWDTIRNSMGVSIFPYGMVSFLDSLGNFKWILIIIGAGLLITGISKKSKEDD